MNSVILYRYRGYRLEIHAEGCRFSVSAEPARPDLPIIARRARDFAASEYEALSAAKRRIDRVLEDREE